MGTNYYLRVSPCQHCGRSDSALHIGKSSAGWCFALNTNPGIASLDDWRRKFAEDGITIEDEYGQTMTVPEMITEITERVGSGRKYSDFAGMGVPS